MVYKCEIMYVLSTGWIGEYVMIYRTLPFGVDKGEREERSDIKIIIVVFLWVWRCENVYVWWL